jgi:hypothetical protein
MNDKQEGRKARRPRVVRLVDLAPRQDVVGGAGKLVFGEGVMKDRAGETGSFRGERSRARGPKRHV